MAQTQGDLITIDSEAFKKFKAELDSINAGLLEIGNALGGIEQKFKKIQFRNIGMNELNDLLVQVNGFRGVGNTKKFQALSNVLDTLLEVSDKAKKLNPSAFKTVSEFFRAFATLGNQPGAAPTTKNSLIDRFKDLAPVVQEVVNINTALKGVNLTNVSKLGGFIKDISAAFAGEPINTGDVVKFSIAMSLLAPGFKLLAFVVRLIPDGGELVRLGQVFKNLGVAFKDLSTAFQGDILSQALRFGVVFPILVTSLSFLFKGMALILSLVPGGETLKILGRVFQQLGSAFVELQKAFSGSILRSLAIYGLIFPLLTTALFILFKGIAAVLSLVPGDETLKTLGRAFKQIGEAFQALQNVFGKTSILKNFVIFGVLFPVVFTFLSFFLRGIASILKLLPGEGALKDLAAIFRQIGLAFQRLTEIFNGSQRGTGSIASSIGTFIKLAVVVPILFAVMGALFKGIASVLRAIPDGGALAALGTVFQQIGQAFKNFNTVFSGGFFQVLGTALKLAVVMPLVFGAIAKVFTSITANLVRQGLVDEFLKFTKSFRNLGEGLKSLAAGSNAISLGGLIALSIKLKVLAVVIKNISQSANLGENKNAETLGTTVRSIGKGLVSLAQALKIVDGIKFNIATLLKLVVFVAVMRQVIKSVAAVAKDTTGSQLENAARLFEGVSKVLEILFTTLTSAALNQTNIKGALSAKDRINIIKDIFNALKQFKNAKLPDIGSILSALPTIFNTFDQEHAIPSSFKDSIKNLAAGIKELKGIKFNATDADSIAKVLTALNGINGSKTSGGLTPDSIIDPKGSSKNAEILGETIANGVEAGIFRVDLKKAILNIFVQLTTAIIGLFNPVRIFKGFFSGLTTLVDFAGKLNSAYQAVVDKLKHVGDSIKQVGETVQNFGQTILSNFGVGGLVSSGAFQSATGFDQLTTEVKTFGNLTEEETKKLRGLAFQLGKDFPLSANEALSAAKDLIKAGLNSAEIQKALPIITQLTSLTDSKDIGLASQGIIQAVAVFKQFTKDVPAGFDNASTAADLLAKAADGSQASVESLIEGIGKVGPVASQFGLTMEDTVAVLGLFSNAGIQGAEAGTQLKSLLTSLNTETAQKELKRLGVSIVDAKGNFKDFNTIITDIGNSFEKTTPVYSTTTKLTKDQKTTFDLATKAIASAQRNLILYQNQLTTGSIDQDTANKAMDKYKKVIENAQNTLAGLTGNQKEAAKIVGEVTRSQQQNAESLLKLGGSYGSVGLAALLAAGDNGIGAFEAAMKKLPSAAERSRQLLDNFNGDVIQLQGSIDTLAVEVIEPTIATVFRPFVQVARALVDTFVALDPEVLATVGTMISLASIAATVVGGLAVIGGTIASLGGSVIALGASLLSVQAIFVGLVEFTAGFAIGLASILAVALPLVAAGYAIAKVFRTVLRIFQDDIGGAGSAFSRFTASIGRSFTRLKGVFSAVGDIIGAIFGDAGTTDLTQAGGAIASIFDRMNEKVIHFTAFLVQAKKVLDEFNIAIRLGQITSAAADTLATNPVMKLLFGLRGEASTSDNVKKLFASIKDRVAQIKSAFSGLTDVFKTFFGDIGSGKDFGKSISKFVSNLKLQGGKLASQVIKLFADIFKFDPKDITDKLDTGNILGAVQAVIGKLLDALKNFLLSNRSTITNIATSIFSFVFTPGKFLSTILKVIGLDKPAAIIDDVGKAINSLFKGIVDFAFNLLSGQDIGTAFSNAFRPVGLDVTNAIQDAISNAISGIGDVLNIDTTGFLDQLDKGFQPLKDALSGGTGAQVLQGIGTAVVTAISVAIQTGFTALGDLLGLNVQPLVDQVANAFTALGNAFQTGDPTTIFGALATTILTALVSALELGLLTIGKLFNFDAQAIIDQLVAGLQPLIDGINSRDPIEIFNGIVTAVTTAIGTALATGLSTLGSILNIDVTAMTESIRSGIQSNIDAANIGGPGGAFFVLANSILTVLTTAIETAFAGIGKILNIDTAPMIATIKSQFSDVVKTLQDIFLGADGTSIFDNINTTVQHIKEAFDKLFGVFTPASTAQVQTAINPLQSLLNLFTGLAGLTLSAIEQPLKLLDNIFTALAAADPTAIVVICAAIGLMVGTFAVGNVIKAAPELLNLIKGAANSTLLKGAAILILIDFVNLIFDAVKQTGGIHSLADVFTILTTALANLGIQILKGVGLNDLANQIQTTVGQLGAVFGIIGAQITIALGNVFRNLSLGFEGLVNDAKITGQKIKNGLNLDATAGLDAGVTAITDELSKALSLHVGETGDLQNAAGEAAHSFFDFFNQVVATGVGPFGDPVSGPLLKEKLRVDFLKNLPDVLNILATQYATKMKEGDAEGARKVIADSIPTLIFTGGVVDAARLAAQNGDTNLLNTIISEAAKQGADPATLNKLAGTVQDAFTAALASGNVDNIKAAQALLDNLIKNASTLGLDPVALKAMKDNIDRQVANLLGGAGPGKDDGKGTKVPVAVTVDPTVTDTKADLQKKAQDAAEKRLAEADAGGSTTAGGTPLNVNVPVTTTAVAVQAETDKLSISLAELSTKLAGLKTDTQTTKDGVLAAVKDMADILGPFFEGAKNDSTTLSANFIAVGVASGLMAVAVGLSAAAIIVSTTLMSAVLTPFLDHTDSKLNSIVTQFGLLGVTMLTQVPTVVTASLLLDVAITKFTTDAVSGLNTLLDKLQALSDKLTEVAGKFAAIANAKVPDPPGGGGGGGDGKGGAGGKGGQAGITTHPDRLYQVIEAGEPELYQANGKTYLIPSSLGVGQVIPAINASSISGTATTVPNSKASNQPLAGSGTVTYNEGDISIVVNGTGLNANEIAAAVQQKIEQKQAADRQTVRDRLRTAAR